VSKLKYQWWKCFTDEGMYYYRKTPVTQKKAYEENTPIEFKYAVPVCVKDVPPCIYEVGAEYRLHKNGKHLYTVYDKTLLRNVRL
jgi:hypothetical protein